MLMAFQCPLDFITYKIVNHGKNKTLKHYSDSIFTKSENLSENKKKKKQIFMNIFIIKIPTIFTSVSYLALMTTYEYF